ncbi:hypothetical protein FRC01_012066 [Tulasnella sp. 417]|nr:hypothetical protein FRC01_012066 [Tulasnella sp. 417]
MADHATTPISNPTDSASQRSSFLERSEDILILIIEVLDRHDQTFLARTCRYICKLVEPLLYRHLGNTSRSEYCQLDYPRLFITLIARPELIQYIHSYAGPLSPYLLGKDREQRLTHSSSDAVDLTLTERIEVSTTIFSQAANIRDVHFVDDFTFHAVYLRQPVSQALFDKKLERIAVFTFIHPFSIDALLRAQPGLKRLEITLRVVGLEYLDETDLGLLEELECRAVQVASLVPGRPVRVLKLWNEDDELVLGEELFQHLALSTGPIVKFSISLPPSPTSDMFQRTIQFVRRYLPQVQSLTVKVNRSISGDLSQSPNAVLEPFAPNIADYLIGQTSKKAHLSNVTPPWATADQAAKPSPPIEPSQRCSFLELPMDVLLLVIEALTQHARTCLARTCRYLRKQVEPLLYRHLGRNDGPKYRYWNYAILFDTLMARQELIKHIHSYEGPFIPQYMKKDEEENLKRRCHIANKLEQKSPPPEGPLTEVESIEISTTLFSQATNIRDVHFAHICSPKENGLWEAVSKALADKKLEILAVVYITQPIPVAALLRTQSELRVLAIYANATGWQDLEEDHLPKLERLKCKAVQARSLVPGRPVTVLELLEEDDERVLGEDLFQKLVRSTRPITEFTIQFPYDATYGIFQGALQNISRYLPEVEDLTIRVNGFISGDVVSQCIDHYFIAMPDVLTENPPPGTLNRFFKRFHLSSISNALTYGRPGYASQ